MRRRIQLSGVFLPSPLILLLMSGAALFAPNCSHAQCPDGSLPLTTTYNFPLSSAGGNVYNLTIPQFSTAGGYTLLSFGMTAVATTSSTVDYKNTASSPTPDLFPTFSRTDNFKINGVTWVNKNNEYDYDQTNLAASGTPGDEISYGPLNTFDNATLFTSSITSAGTLNGNFVGTGNMTLKYTSSFFLNNNIPNTVNVSSTISDDITLSVSYKFCNPVVLASNILTFTATKENSQTVDLDWMVTNEEPGRKYYIEVTSGTQDYAIAGSVPSNASSTEASYSYKYAIPPTATGKLYFRLRQVEPDGKASWSNVCTVNLDGNNTVFSIYPNPPSDFINLTIPGDNQDWQVDIVAADGALVQRNFYRSSNAVKVNFVRRLSAGTYFVRAVNPQTGKSYSGSFLIR